MPRRAALANALWLASARPDAARFDHALRHPDHAQRRLLHHALTRLARTAFGHDHGLSRHTTAADFADRVPLQTYDGLAPYIARIRRGERRVLTADPVTRLIPTSGSTAAAKLIPFTRALQRQFNAAIRPWIADLFTRHPDACRGPAYWSISPASSPANDPPGGSNDNAVPVGFDDDAAYLGPLARRLIDPVLAVPPTVRHHADPDDFRFATLFHLLRAPSLRLVSVWHPSFLTLLLDALPPHFDRLLDALSTGVCRAALGEVLYRTKPLHPRHLDRLRRADPADPASLWPDLTVVSAWADAAAAAPFSSLAGRLPGVHLQPKGLISTEAFVSLPYRGAHPAAVTSHLIELLDDDGGVHPLHHAEPGGRYEPVVTTAGGLTRYRTGDIVEVTGRLHATPTLRFLGRTATSDLVGEKLTDAFAAAALAAACRRVGVSPAFAMLTPDPGASAAAPPHYTLWLEMPAVATYVPRLTPHAPRSRTAAHRLAAALDDELARNPHYAYARRIGQLGPVHPRPAPPDAVRRLIVASPTAAPLGAVKLPTLGTPAHHDALERPTHLGQRDNLTR